MISLVAALAIRGWFLLLIALSVVVVLFGVLLPAVWSSKPSRRQAARTVLEAALQWSLDLLVRVEDEADTDALFPASARHRIVDATESSSTDRNA
ncbi:hypothetical protein BJY14_007595 [Actinomadura luteofluorescens]|uniref:Uncharacterized protein n=1 Tax=Actinomadura luteofluorescens TaxID=46163 RepID=A0A7Y9EPM7_9ACTN|nr:hypothetical protein [Actinomadura luteofluorescens]NYD51612.1 hypothetical protein [Actinomadura luteofluorescens]